MDNGDEPDRTRSHIKLHRPSLKRSQCFSRASDFLAAQALTWYTTENWPRRRRNGKVGRKMHAFHEKRPFGDMRDARSHSSIYGAFIVSEAFGAIKARFFGSDKRESGLLTILWLDLWGKNRLVKSVAKDFMLFLEISSLRNYFKVCWKLRFRWLDFFEFEILI